MTARKSPPIANPKEIVRRGYDAVSHLYRDDRGTDSEAYNEFLQVIVDRVPPGASILDLGCGNGIPAARFLAERFNVTGVDISDVQIERARRLVPAARFLQADMTELTFPQASFAAVVSLYAIIHVPLPEQPSLFHHVHRWLEPGGLFVATLGSTAWTGTESHWLGGTEAMYWSHADAATYDAWLGDAGFTVETTRFIPEGRGGHTLFVAVRNDTHRKEVTRK